MTPTTKKILLSTVVAAAAISILIPYGMSSPDTPNVEPSTPNVEPSTPNVEPSTPNELIVPDTGVTSPTVDTLPTISAQNLHFPSSTAELDIAVSRATSILDEEITPIPDSIAAANNGFAMDFYRQVSGDDKNIFFSPLSMFVVFSAVYEGAREDSADQLQKAFGFEPDFEVRYNDTIRLISSINRDDPHAELDLANALWVDDEFNPKEPYVNAVRGVYLADVEVVDFMNNSESGGAERINAWASEKTHGKIDRVIDYETAMTLSLALTNAVYFNGTWEKPFPESKTYEGTFYKSSSETVKAEFMYNAHGGTFTDEPDGYQILKLPYEGDRLSMLVILPDDYDGIDDIEKTISSDQLAQWTKNQERWQETEVILPKFKIETKYDLEDPLFYLGVHDIFDYEMANLTGIWQGHEKLFVSTAVQKAYVDVNEQGTEAAAVTVTGFTITSAPPRFVADHPFIFIIQDDESGTILFMGRISDPT